MATTTTINNSLFEAECNNIRERVNKIIDTNVAKMEARDIMGLARIILEYEAQLTALRLEYSNLVGACQSAITLSQNLTLSQIESPSAKLVSEEK